MRSRGFPCLVRFLVSFFDASLGDDAVGNRDEVLELEGNVDELLLFLVSVDPPVVEGVVGDDDDNTV
jgi:hypothetical protein